MRSVVLVLLALIVAVTGQYSPGTSPLYTEMSSITSGSAVSASETALGTTSSITGSATSTSETSSSLTSSVTSTSTSSSATTTSPTSTPTSGADSISLKPISAGSGYLSLAMGLVAVYFGHAY
ncbi:hypothetical protein V1508DRAFT_421884 [Lipomyces doorenjongii]|uniref:uncharacterized protein n=1 Tax=Lipomyces doorenjongii TaxID=383834 RepID=UPI0034D01F80